MTFVLQGWASWGENEPKVKLKSENTQKEISPKKIRPLKLIRNMYSAQARQETNENVNNFTSTQRVDQNKKLNIENHKNAPTQRMIIYQFVGTFCEAGDNKKSFSESWRNILRVELFLYAIFALDPTQNLFAFECRACARV